VVCDSCAPPGSPRLDRDTITLLSSLLTGDWAHAESTPERTQGQATGIVAAYTQWHLERGLRSLEHVSR
jgi:DNA repair protein RecO (recombination protein O)